MIQKEIVTMKRVTNFVIPSLSVLVACTIEKFIVISLLVKNSPNFIADTATAGPGLSTESTGENRCSCLGKSSSSDSAAESDAENRFLLTDIGAREMLSRSVKEQSTYGLHSCARSGIGSCYSCCWFLDCISLDSPSDEWLLFEDLLYVLDWTFSSHLESPLLLISFSCFEDWLVHSVLRKSNLSSPNPTEEASKIINQ